MDMVLRHGIPAHVIQTFDYMTLIVSLSHQLPYQCTAEIGGDHALRPLAPLPLLSPAVRFVPSLTAWLRRILLVLGSGVESCLREVMTPPQCDDPSLRDPSVFTQYTFCRQQV